MATRSIEAATRLREDLERAKAGGYYTHGWYAYMRRWDIETLIEYVLGPAECACNPGVIDPSLSEARQRITCGRCGAPMPLKSGYREETT